MKRVSLAVAILLLAAFLLTPGLTQSKKKISTLKTQAKNLENKKKSLRSELRQVKRTVADIMSNIESVDAELESLENKLDANERRLTRGKSEQIRLQKSLEKATTAVANKKKQAAVRIREMYMSEQESGILSLLASKNVGELAARKRVMELLARKDRDIFDGLKVAQKQVELDKVEQDRVVKDIGAAIAELKVDKAEVQKKRTLKAQLLAEIQQEKAGLESEYAKLDRESDAIESLLRSYQQRAGGGGVVFRGKFIRPVNGPVTSGYGYRHHPILKRSKLHTGIDFGARTGTPIVASAAGTVISAGYRGGYGYTVLIDHGSGLSTLYGHCSRIFVKSGARVSQGQRIAAVGSTGLSTGPHLHFEIRVNGKPVNPSSRM